MGNDTITRALAIDLPTIEAWQDQVQSHSLTMAQQQALTLAYRGLLVYTEQLEATIAEIRRALVPRE